MAKVGEMQPQAKGSQKLEEAGKNTPAPTPGRVGSWSSWQLNFGFQASRSIGCGPLSELPWKERQPLPGEAY